MQTKPSDEVPELTTVDAYLADPSERSWYQTGDFVPVSELSEAERKKRHLSLVKDLVVAQVRAQLTGCLYDSPLVYTNKGLDPTVDKQVLRLRQRLDKVRSQDPQKYADVARGYLFGFRQKSFKF